MRKGHNTTGTFGEVLRPIASLISKSEKAQQKLTAGTWQHKMLQDNIKALYIASALINKDADNSDPFIRNDLQDALQALTSMLDKVEKTAGKFSLGTAQHTLQRNRLNALRIAESVIKVELNNLYPNC